MVATVKRYLIAVALTCTFALGLAATSFAQYGMGNARNNTPHSIGNASKNTLNGIGNASNNTFNGTGNASNNSFYGIGDAKQEHLRGSRRQD